MLSALGVTVILTVGQEWSYGFAVLHVPNGGSTSTKAVRRTEIEHEKEEIYFDDRFCLWGKGQYAYKYVCAPAVVVTFSLPLVCLLHGLSVRCMQSCGTTATHLKPLCYVFGLPAQVRCSDIIIIHSFYIALFSALEQTHCAHWHVILNE